jgi:mannan endo-1,4-beta-mannosidase
MINFIGGMDAYVTAFQPNGTHDLFYTDPTIIQTFKNYVSAVVSRYGNCSTILAWELANDPRCSSTLPASSSCNPQTITKWVAELCE